MSAAATSRPAPGWYPDPKDPSSLRWWDGKGWTAFTNELPAPPEGAASAEPEPEPDAEPAPEPLTAAGAAFRAALREARAEREQPMPAPDPLAAMAAPGPVEPEPESEPVVVEPEPEPLAAATLPLPIAPRPSRSRRLGKGVTVLAAIAAGGVAFVAVNGGDDPSSGSPTAGAKAAVAAADKACLVEWNTTSTPEAAQLRVTLGQFSQANAWVGRVAPLPGTVMGPNSCALTVYDPATDTSARFVSGVKDQLGYMDVTTYPRASRLPAPRAARDANIRIQSDGTIRAITR